eukprot:scaffold15777_cov70-Cylindrotheca_fusiformis.AAC.1
MTKLQLSNKPIQTHRYTTSTVDYTDANTPMHVEEDPPAVQYKEPDIPMCNQQELGGKCCFGWYARCNFAGCVLLGCHFRFASAITIAAIMSAILVKSKFMDSPAVIPPA